ncbi:MAG: OFA family MFS transporter [Eubacteriales bacterium]
MVKKREKWIRAAIPALMIHCSIGTVYCWSLIKGDIASYIGCSSSAVEWAFSLAIFFLGMSAAFAGKIVEQDIHRATLIATICFSVGLVGTGISVYFKSIIGVYICYGVIMGIGLGIGYLSPVKTLMLWFSEHKGLATGIAVAGFGLAKVIASPLMTFLIASVGIINMFYVLAAFYFIVMMIGHFMLRKPEGWVEDTDDHGKPAFTVLKQPVFIGIWLMFYINITCGLALISQEKDILYAMGASATLIAAVASLTAIFNVLGRIGYSTLADELKDRCTIYKFIFILSVVMTVVLLITDGIASGMIPLAVVLLCVVNAGYGGGFSNLPTLLSDFYGMKQVSQIHGLALSAWAFAGLSGNQLSSYIVHYTSYSYEGVLVVTGVLYLIAFVVSMVLVRKKD